jgi:non-heme chloroperoxidase
MRIYALTSQVIVGYVTPPLEYRNLEEAKPMNRQDVLMSTIAAGTAGAAIYDQSLAKPPGATGVAHTRKLQTSDGLSLFHREWGTGRSAVFVHSLALSSAMWAYQEEFLGSRGVRCVSYDRRGHGLSEVTHVGLDVDAFADDLHAVIEGLGLRDVVLVGHSVGAADIIRYVSRHGSRRVAKIALLAPTTPYVLQTADNPYGAPREYFEKIWSDWATDYPKWLQDNRLAAFTPETSPQMMDWIQHQMIRMHVSTAIAINRAVVTTDLRADLGKIDRPVLVLQGDKDASAPLEITGRRTAAGIRDAVLKVYSGAPHLLFLTHMAQVNRDLLEFIAG